MCIRDSVYVNKYVTDDKGKIEIVFNKNSMTYNCLKDAKNFKISSEQDTDCKGAEIQKDKEGKISGCLLYTSRCV